MPLVDLGVLKIIWKWDQLVVNAVFNKLKSKSVSDCHIVHCVTVLFKK